MLPPPPSIPPLLRRHPGWWGIWLISLLPLPVLHLLADGLALLLQYVVGYRRQVVEQNLTNSFPEKTAAERARITRQFYRNLADILVETVKLATISADELQARFTYPDTDILTDRLRAGQTVLVLGSHQNNWEWVLPSGQQEFRAFRIDGVYRPLSSAFGEALLTYLRTRLGGLLVKMQDVGRNMVRLRGVPRVLSMIADQTPTSGEIQFYTPFLHQDTPFFVGADKLAASLQLPVLYFYTVRLGRGRYEGRFRLLYDGVTPLPPPPKRVTDNLHDHPITEAYARVLEADIRAAPASYLWSHRRWKNARPGR